MISGERLQKYFTTFAAKFFLMIKSLPLFVVTAIFSFVACNSSNEKNNTEQRTTFFDKAGMDSSIKPGDNFFLYANGGWIKANKIPEDQSGWGSFYTLYEENLKKLKGILEEASAKNAAKGTAEQKVGDFYVSGMDTVAIEKKGYDPIKPLLAKIDAVKDYKELMNLIAESYPEGDGFTFNVPCEPYD